jgi:hypothetical protein
VGLFKITKPSMLGTSCGDSSFGSVDTDPTYPFWCSLLGGGGEGGAGAGSGDARAGSDDGAGNDGVADEERVAGIASSGVVTEESGINHCGGGVGALAGVHGMDNWQGDGSVSDNGVRDDGCAHIGGNGLDGGDEADCGSLWKRGERRRVVSLSPSLRSSASQHLLPAFCVLLACFCRWQERW